MASITRSQRILSMSLRENDIQLRLNLPSYDTTKLTTDTERQLAITRWNACYGQNESDSFIMETRLVATDADNSNVESMQIANEINFEGATPIIYEVENMLQADEEMMTEGGLKTSDVGAGSGLLTQIYEISSSNTSSRAVGLIGIERYFEYSTQHNLIQDGNVSNDLVIPKIPLITSVIENEDGDEDSIIESSGSEYVPSESECIEHDASEDEESLKEAYDDQPIPHQEKHAQKTGVGKCHNNENHTSEANKNDAHNVNSSLIAKENSVLIANARQDEITGKRIRNKVHSCYFCHKTLKQLAVHFEKVHSNENEVANLLAMPKKSRERRNGFGNLLRIGDYYYNCEILTKKEGELILVRRPTSQENAFVNYSDYGPCPDCLGFMLKQHIWHHLKFGCTAKKIKEGRTMHRKPMSESVALISHTFDSTLSNDFAVNILAKLKEDRMSLVCRQDNLIMQFGALQFEKYHTTQCELIRQSMRQLSRLVLELRRMDSSKVWLSQWLTPECFDLVVLAVKNICFVCYQKTNRPQFSIPSLALKLGHSLRKCIAIERGNGLRKGDLKRNEDLNSLLSIMDLEWNIKISSNALATLHNRKLNATELLPLTDDLIKLNGFLNVQMTASKESLLNSNTYYNWSRLAAIVLSRIVLFNKRRSGEASKMTVEQYSSRPNWNKSGTEEFKKTLSPLELELAARLTLVQIVGKRGRTVSVLLTEDVKQVIDLLIKTRSAVCIAKDNPYIFARGGDSTGHIRGHDCLRKLCLEAELLQPELINGTKLRKYIATVCQIFDLTDNESDWLARHLGHDIRVHRDFYRLHDSSIEMTKISRLLIAVEQGEASRFHGKKLKDINIIDLPDLENEEDNLEESDCEENIEENKEDDNKDNAQATSAEASIERKSTRVTRTTPKDINAQATSAETSIERKSTRVTRTTPKDINAQATSAETSIERKSTRVTRTTPKDINAQATSAKTSIERKSTRVTRTTPKDITSIKTTTRKDKKTTARKSKTRSGRAAVIKRPWSEQESGAVVSFFRTLIKTSTVPGKIKCEECIESHRDVLSSRSWKDVKYYVKNYLTKVNTRK